MALSAPRAVERLSRFSLTTAHADELAAFYESAFACRRLRTERLSGTEFETLMGVSGGALRTTLSLGEQIVELLQFDRTGEPYPKNASTSDLIFQHFAIVVSDMTEAYRRLSAIDGWTAISRAGPQRLPESSGGVTAFKFRDPEGHPLEFLAFPRTALPPPWRTSVGTGGCVGIDHSAIGVSSSARSITFYENLGFCVSAHSSNHGPAQDNLDNLAGIQAEITALTAHQTTPHLELICYGEVAPRHAVTLCNADIATTRLVFEASGATVSRVFADPDGHRLLIEGAVPFTS
jgi:catechol 2,3-dioxygenase-like lactoylglutathione lyase family enzyme